MSLKTTSLATRISACLLLACTCTHAFAVDVVTRRSDGTAFRGKITKATKDAITVQRSAGQSQVISVADLKSVSFDGEPSQVAQARTNERGGAIDPAITKLEEVRRNGSASSKLMREEVEFLLARLKTRKALVDATQADAAVAATDAFRRAHPDSYRYYETTLLQASLLALKKDADAAKVLLKEVQACPVVGFQLQAGVDLGRVLLANGDSALAQTSFDGVIAKATDPNSAAVKFDARIGKAMCLQADTDFAKAISVLDEVIKDSPGSETRLLADAWIKKGDCLRLQNQNKAAVMAYLHVDLLYAAESAQHAEALHHLASLWGSIGHQDRAAEASAMLTERYPQSPWARGGQ